jgi:hypothetical protein
MWEIHADSIPNHMTVAAFLRHETDFEAAIAAVSNIALEQLVAIRAVPGVEVPSQLERAFAAAFDLFDLQVWESQISQASPGYFRNLSLAHTGHPVAAIDPYLCQKPTRLSGADHLAFVHRSPVGNYLEIGALLDQFTLTVGTGRLTVLVPPNPRDEPLVHPHRDTSVFEEIRLDVCLTASPGMALSIDGVGDLKFNSLECLWMNCSGYEHTLVNRNSWLGSRCSMHFSVWPWIEFDHQSRTYRPNRFYGLKHPIQMIIDGDLTR